ncbi:hypothetical protein KBA73_04385 [Patescibacteria group bacterium]|nr:hypothetical protein [Patescibacteria group bacterium]
MPVVDALKIRRFVVEELTWESASVYTLRLSPQTSEDQVTFTAGQWVYWHLLNPDGTSWGRAAFSFASSPKELEGSIQLAIKIEKDFTKKGGSLQPGDVVGVQGPFGVFVLPKELPSSLVLFAGGIGIAPLRSMIRELHLTNAAVPITLFYSNRYIEDAVYFEEFQELAKSWPLLTFVPTLTGEDNPSIWKGELGRLSRAMIQKYVPDLQKPLYYMCGPDSFMDAIQGIMAEAGVDTKKQLKKELFG